MTEDGKLKIDNIHRKTSREYTNYLLSAEDRYRAEGTTEGRKQNRNKSKSSSRDKAVNIAAVDFDDALVCYVKNTVEDHIMDSGASFHATYCKEELEKFKLRSGLKRRLISVGQLDEKVYHVGFEDQQWKVTKGSLVVARGNKHESLYMVEHQRLGDMSRIGMNMLASKGNVLDVRKAMDLHLLYQSEDPATMILLSKTAVGVAFGVAERLNQTFRAESMGLRAEAPKILWADSVSTTYLIYRIPYVLIGLHIPKEEWRGKDTSLAYLKAVAQMKCDTAFGIRRVTSTAGTKVYADGFQLLEELLLSEG
ncbi:hypothetical protein Tco_0273543 [Tanacetum coccineum]